MSLICLMTRHARLEFIQLDTMLFFTSSLISYLLPFAIPVNNLYTGRMVFLPI